MPQVAAVAAVVLSAVTTVVQVKAARKAERLQSKALKKSEKAANETNKIVGASEDIRNRLARRQAAKEERIRRSRIMQSSTNSGASGSSGTIGATSSLSANFGTSLANQQSEILTTQGVTKQNQTGIEVSRLQSKANSAISFGKQVGAVNDLFQEGIEFGKNEGWFS